jgi:hypothetical protein
VNRSILALLALAVTASCGDGGTDPTNLAASGTVAFSYNGGALVAAGSYNATGGLPQNQTDVQNQTWAAGYRDTQNGNVLGVISTFARSGRYDMAAIYFDRSTTGSSTVDLENCAAEVCPAMIFWYNLSESSTATGEVLCGLETGTLTIASISSTTASGSFSGTGSCISLDAGTESTFTVSYGSFNVPIVADPGIGAGLAIRDRR